MGWGFVGMLFLAISEKEEVEEEEKDFVSGANPIKYRVALATTRTNEAGQLRRREATQRQKGNNKMTHTRTQHGG